MPNPDGTVTKRTGDANTGTTAPSNRNPLRKPLGRSPNGGLKMPVKKTPGK